MYNDENLLLLRSTVFVDIIMVYNMPIKPAINIFKLPKSY